MDLHVDRVDRERAKFPLFHLKSAVSRGYKPGASAFSTNTMWCQEVNVAYVGERNVQLVPWVDKVCRALLVALSQWNTSKPAFLQSKTELEDRSTCKLELSHSSSLLKVRPLMGMENHLLKCIFNRLSLKDPSVLGQDKTDLARARNKSVETAMVCPSLELQNFLLGIFLQVAPVKQSTLLKKLDSMKRNQTVNTQSTFGLARLQGELQIVCSNMDCAEAHKVELAWPQKDRSSDQKQRPLVALHGRPFKDLQKLLTLANFVQYQQPFPDKQILNFMEDFFAYTESEGRRFFQALDRDNDDMITLDDMRAAVNKMKLPSLYARLFLHSARKHCLANSFGWPEFSSLVQEKEPVMISLFNSLGVSKCGTLERAHIQDLLRATKQPDTESNVTAMMKLLGADLEGSIKYSQFREFMLFIPTEQLKLDPWTVWLKAATCGG